MYVPTYYYARFILLFEVAIVLSVLSLYLLSIHVRPYSLLIYMPV